MGQKEEEEEQQEDERGERRGGGGGGRKRARESERERGLTVAVRRYETYYNTSWVQSHPWFLFRRFAE